MNRGDVYLADLNPSRGSEQSGIRPVAIIQRNTLARFTSTIVVVPFTTNLRRAMIPGTVLIPAEENGLTRDSVALCYQIAVLDRSRLTKKLGSLTTRQLANLDQALKYALDL
ncbi:MAG: type II toxin-antitoxin system PemK/MazF family toxin [Candidatus Omnitrophota bacterium]